MGIWNLIAGPILKIIDKVIPDRAAAAAAQAQVQMLAAQGALQEELLQLTAITTAQSDINKVEAASTNWFVAGGRPFIMWVCGVTLALNYVVGPIFTWLAMVVGHPCPFPKLDIESLMPLLVGMLGLGTLRTQEKIKGVAGTH